ncbi:MAG: adenylate/guanylate cyclase domain-containing protein, partial [Myxococcota bacterium]
MRDLKQRQAYLSALCRTVPYHIVEEILETPSERSIRSESFVGTVLVMDLVGFTPLCERLAHSGEQGLSRLSLVLNRLFGTLLDDAIFPYAGYVVQFGGDSITAFYRGEDDARRAVASALTTQRLMHGELGRLVEGQSRELMLRVGLARGEVALPVLGDLTRRAAVVAGEASKRALVMQRFAPPNSIKADAEVVAAIEGNAELVDRSDDGAVVRALREWPTTHAYVPLEDRIQHDVEEKIALLEPFVPSWLASRLRTKPEGWRIDPELRNVVVLFAELWGIDRASGGSEVALHLSRSILRAFRRYGGLTLKGDICEQGHRVMVLFGLHEPNENDSERALLAALEATARVRGYGASRNLNVGVRCGIHCGTVYFGAIGSDSKHDITVVGDAVNVAARAASEADPFSVIATESVLSRAGNEFRASDKGPIRVKGKADPIRLYLVHSPTEGKSHFARSRATSRFRAGRTTQVERLSRAVDEAMEGKGVVLGLFGDAGAGKSSMLGEVIDRWIRAGGVGVVGRCRYATSMIPLAPIVSMFENFLGITSGDTEEQRRERIRGVLHRYDLPDGAPELVSLLQPVRRPDGSTEALVDLADSHTRERVLGSITRFLEQRFQEEPLLYVVEDIHFADTLSLQLAMRLWALGRSRPFMMIGTYRPEAHLDELRRTLDFEVELPNLSLTESTQLVSHELGGESVDADLGVFMWERTGGNPGYLVELLRFFSDRELLQVRAGVVSATGGIQALKDIVPDSLAHVALAGLNHLGEVERRVLRTASAIGRRFDRGLLGAVSSTELDQDMVVDAVARLEGERVIAADSSAGYMFRDDVTRAVAYSTIPEGERREVHSRIAATLEALPENHPSRSAAALAHHHERAGHDETAIRWYERAARLAMRASLDRETVYLVDQWREVWGRLPEARRPPTSKEARMTMLKFLAVARQGVPKDTVEAGKRLDQRLWDELDENARAAIDYWVGEALIGLGHPEKARERLKRAFDSHARDHLRSDAARLLARIHSQAYEHDDARTWLRTATDLAADDPYRQVRISLGAAYVLVAEGKLD